jgi:hypothetical protein
LDSKGLQIPWFDEYENNVHVVAMMLRLYHRRLRGTRTIFMESLLQTLEAAIVALPFFVSTVVLVFMTRVL